LFRQIEARIENPAVEDDPSIRAQNAARI